MTLLLTTKLTGNYCVTVLRHRTASQHPRGNDEWPNGQDSGRPGHMESPSMNDHLDTRALPEGYTPAVQAIALRLRELTRWQEKDPRWNN